MGRPIDSAVRLSCILYMVPKISISRDSSAVVQLACPLDICALRLPPVYLAPECLPVFVCAAS